MISPALCARLAASALLIFFLPLALASGEKTRPSGSDSPLAEGAAEERPEASDWVGATGEYRKSLEKVLVLYRLEFQQRAERVVQLRGFYEKEWIARSELEESQRALSELEGKLRKAEAELAEVDLAIGAAARKESLPVSTPVEETLQARTLIHHDGRAAWSLAALERIEGFFRERFSRYLPISASGQTAVHDRLQLDHRNAVDVAVHPDSPEGQALMTYLREEGMPFIAFRGPVAGAATGAHIHIGRPSVRLSAAARGAR